MSHRKPQSCTRRLLLFLHRTSVLPAVILLLLCFTACSTPSESKMQGSTCKNVWSILYQRARAQSRALSSTSGKTDPRNKGECLERENNTTACECGFALLDSCFFSDKKMLEIEKGAKELNTPIIRANQKLVASVNGGLYNPSPLVFNAAWSDEHLRHMTTGRFSYPSPSDVQRPENDEDIAFMSIPELGELIKTKQVTSVELTGIFLKRLKRYGPVLESVVTLTKELAYQQAKVADQLLAKGEYLGT